MLVTDKLKDQENFTNTDKRIADYILHNITKVPTITIEDLANQTYASHSAVIRLCKKIGYSGFRTFKSAISEFVYSKLHTQTSVNANFPFEPEDSAISIAKKMADLTIASVKKTFAQLDDDMLNQAVTMLTEADRIFLFAQGDSQIRIRSFQNKLIKINKFLILADEYSDKNWNAVNMTKRDCALFVSYAGINSQYKKILQYFQKEEIPTILLTGNNKSDLTKLAALPIVTIQDEYDFVKVGTFSSQVSFEYILDTIFSIMYAQEYEKNVLNLKRKHDILQTGVLKED